MPLFPGTPGPFGIGLTREVCFDAQTDFGFVGDLISVGEIEAAGSVTVMTSGSATLTLTTAAPFTSTAVDGGKRIIVEGAGASGAPLVTTILSVTSASVATLAANAGTTVTATTTVEVNVSFGTDNAAAIAAMQTAVNTTYATFPGARVFFGPSATNAYWFTAPVVFNKMVQIEGIGGGHSADTGAYSRCGGTRLAWGATSQDGGAAFGAFFTFVPTGVQALKRVAMRSCWLDCRNNNQNQALVGLKLSSCHGFMVEDFYIMDAQAIGIWLDIGTTVTEAKDTTRFSIRDVCFRQLDNGTIASLAPMTTPILMTSAVVLTTTPQSLTVAANTLPAVASGYFWTATTMGAPVLVRYTGGGGTTTLTGCTIATEFVVHTPTTVNGGNVVQACPGNAACLIFNGGSTANSCCGVIEMVQISHGTTWGPASHEFWNSDSIMVMQPMVNGGNATNDGVINRIRKPGIRINGSIVSQTLAARNNTIKDGDPGTGGISHMALLNTGALMGFPSGPTYWDLMQLGNAAPIPVREAVTLSATQAPIGSHVDWTPNGGWRPGVCGPVAVANGTIAAASTNYVPGTLCVIPPQGFQVGTTLRWNVWHSKTAAGVAARTILIKYGAAGTSADATIASASITPSSTATADVGKMTIDMVITALGSGSAGTAIAQLMLIHNTAPSASVGGLTNSLAPTPEIAMTMTGFDSTAPAAGPRFLTMWITTGAAEVITILPPTCVECIHGGNP